MRPFIAAAALTSALFLACDTVDDGVDAGPDTIVTADTIETAVPETTPETGDDTAPGIDDTAPEPDAPPETDTTPETDAAPETDTAPEIDDTAPETDDTTPETDTAPEPDAPAPAAPAFDLTIAAIPPEMNGSRPAITPSGELAFRLRANRANVDLDVIARPESGPFTAGELTLACTAAGARHALPAPVEVAPGHLQVRVDEAHAFPDGAAVDCLATVITAGGTATQSYAFDAATLPPELDPFVTTDLWLVVTERDVFTLHVAELPDGTTDLRSEYTPLGDGVDDFDAPFFELGLFPAADPDATAAIRAHLLARVRALANEIYGLDADGHPTAHGVNLRLVFEGDPDAPTPAEFPTADPPFSMIALTGDGSTSDQIGGTFGRALIDWNNQDVEDDTVFGLGVWPAAIARAILGNPAGALLLSDMRPALGGTPYGLAEGDELFIGQDLDPVTLPAAVRQRASRYNLIIRFGALAIAAILTHEIGHSLGLVPFGPPPEGLFAGVNTDWVASFAPDAHIDTIGLNVMQTGASVNWLEAATGDLPRFEPLSWAYLRRQLVVGPP